MYLWSLVNHVPLHVRICDLRYYVLLLLSTWHLAPGNGIFSPSPVAPPGPWPRPRPRCCPILFIIAFRSGLHVPCAYSTCTVRRCGATMVLALLFTLLLLCSRCGTRETRTTMTY